MSDYKTEDSVELSFDDLHFDDVDAKMAEAASEGVLGCGTYLATGTETKMTLVNDRQQASIQFQLTDDNGRKLRKVRVKVSWQAAYAANGRVDKMFKMYSQLVKAVGAADGSPLEVLPLAKEVPVKLNISEAYLVDAADAHEDHADRNQTDDGKIWAILARTTEENAAEVHAVRVHYLSKGLDPIYLTQNIYSA